MTCCVEHNRRGNERVSPGSASLRTVRSAARRSIASFDQILDTAAVESGYDHPSEAYLANHLDVFGEEGLWDAVRRHDEPARAATWLRILGRSDRLSHRLRAELLVWGLRSSSVDVRDAAVQAAENWSDRRLVGVLRGHVEPVDWLQEYASGVVRGMEA